MRRNVISRYVDTPKSGHGRVVELSSELHDALAALREASQWKTGRVFRQDSGRPALARHLYAWMEVATARADIPRRRGARLHVMRHSACSALASMGAPTIAIQALAGHESPQTTAKYMHLAPGVQPAAVRLFDEERGKGVASLDGTGPKSSSFFPAKSGGATGIEHPPTGARKVVDRRVDDVNQATKDDERRPEVSA